MICERCGKWAGAHATLPGQPREHLCMCQPVLDDVMKKAAQDSFMSLWQSYCDQKERIAALEAALKGARDLMDEARTYTSSPSWSPSMTDELTASIAAINEVLPK